MVITLCYELHVKELLPLSIQMHKHKNGHHRKQRKKYSL